MIFPSHHLPDCLQVAISVHHVGHQVTAFHPIVPGIDRDQSGLSGMAVGMSFVF
jgi:hypothetical protein